MSKKIFIALILCFLFLTVSSIVLTTKIKAQVPGLKVPCDTEKDPEFNSNRPYQASPCGDAPKARFCSNKLVFFESFNLAGKGDCTPRGEDGRFTCHPDFKVEPHDLHVELDESMFPILGNTEDVKNSQNSADTLDDATKVNEYVSWYLGGVNNKAEYGSAKNTNTEIINFSGPVQKLLPGAILDAQRISSIEKATKESSFIDEDSDSGGTEEKTEPQNHNQIVVCSRQGNGGFFGTVQDVLGIGKSNPVECYSGNGSNAQGDVNRLKSWEGDLSIWNTGVDSLVNLVTALLPDAPQNLVRDSIGNHWNRRTPPLPWENDPFKNRPMTELEYLKYYNEWRGKTCVIVPIANSLLCLENVFVPNKYADLYQFVPLANTTDKKGANYLLTVDGPNYVASQGTAITNAFHDSYTNAPLYFAHTQEVYDLSTLLNTTYKPRDHESEPLPQSTEQNLTTDPDLCRAVNVRTNKGDDLFPGDGPEISVKGAQYTITEAECEEKYEPPTPRGCGPGNAFPCAAKRELKCLAEVGIELNLGTKTPYATEIFKETVADSASTFRKIFPRVDAGAPVSCIADMPTTTGVTYDPAKSEKPQGGEQTFRVTKIPKDGVADGPQLTFPHIGSVYEYFLKGVQTALRPKGYGEPLVNGLYCNNANCGELPKGLAKASGSCSLGSTSSRVGNIPKSLKDIIESAAETYKVPPDLILGVMYGEGIFNPGKFNWTDQNVKDWATCVPIPGCVAGSADDNFMGFFESDWATISRAIEPDLKKLDPTRAAPNRCNLLDAVYGAAWDLHDNADGSPLFPDGAQCFGKPLNRGTNVPSSCSWDDSQYESAIRVWEFGTGWGQTSLGFFTCATKPGSCLTGGGADAQCEGDSATDFDTCQNTDSHNACVWDVSHGN